MTRTGKGKGPKRPPPNRSRPIKLTVELNEAEHEAFRAAASAAAADMGLDGMGLAPWLRMLGRRSSGMSPPE